MTSLNMIYFEHNMSMIEIEREYMRNMINLEYRGGVLNEDTEIIYEGVFETIKNAILAIFEKIRKLFESVINLFRKTKDNAKNKEVKEIIKKTEENLNNVGQNKKDKLDELKKLYLKPLSGAFASDSKFDFVPIMDDLMDFFVSMDTYSIDECDKKRDEIITNYDKYANKFINAMNYSVNDVKNHYTYQSSIKPIYADDSGFFKFIIDHFGPSSKVEIDFPYFSDISNLKEELRSVISYYYSDVPSCEKYINYLHKYIIQVKDLQRKLSMMQFESEEDNKKLTIYRRLSLSAVNFFQFMLKSYTMLINFEKTNIRYNIRTFFQISKILLDKNNN